MTLYANSELFQKEIDWLLHQCSLPEFASSRVSKFNEHALKEALTKLPSLDTLHVKNYYEHLFKLYALHRPLWSTTCNEEILPVFALVPEKGMHIIIGKSASGWKCETPNGVQTIETFGEGTLFASIRQERQKEQQKTAYAMFKRIALEHKKTIFNAAVATFSISFLALGTSFYSMQVYDRVIPTQGLSTLIALSVGVFIAIFLELLLKIARSIVMDHASVLMDRSYSFRIFDHFLKIRLDAFPTSIGNLSGQLQSYASVRVFITTVALFVTTELPFALFFIVVIGFIGGLSMGIIPLVFFIVSLLTAFFFKKKIEVLTKQSVAASNKKLGLLVESVEKAETIKAYGHGFAVQNRWNALTEDALKDDIAIKHYSDSAAHIAAFLQQLSYVALVCVGAYLAATTDKLTMGGLIAISILSGRALTPLAGLPNLFVQWARAKMSVEDLNRIYALACDNEGIDKPLTPTVLPSRFTCKNVKFSYTQDSKPISIQKLEINEGERVAILGAIGSGKSTILKLLAALYAPQEGEIVFGGLDIRHISRDTLSATIGYLPQDIKLFSGTLRDNLTLGLIGIADDAILEAAQKTGLMLLINALPKGLDTLVPEGGNSVSGGQKQLIALTRLLLAKPNVWLLDEPTANIDDASEMRMINVLTQEIRPTDTLVVVTHKPTLLRLVNRIVIVTSEGVIMDGARDLVLAELTKKQQLGNNAPKGPSCEK